MRYRPRPMRLRSVLAIGALTAAVLLISVPAMAGATSPGRSGVSELTDFRRITIAGTREPLPSTVLVEADPGLSSTGRQQPDTSFPEAGEMPPPPPADRPSIPLPGSNGGFEWKPARYTLTGTATFYDHGGTAMRLPYGTVIRVCGSGGCLERVVTDYGPFGNGRIIDLYRPDFFAICGCASWAGTATVTVHVY